MNQKVAKLHEQISAGSSYSQIPLKFSNEVRRAVETQQANLIVALESTIITHGMPYPENIHCAQSVENIIRSHGAIPATIAILDGIIHVGLEECELMRLALLGSESKVLKCSRRDLPYILALKRHGALTVSGTMFVAHHVGVKIFVTGGIGGVHRDGHISMDISADLTELGRIPVCVICAGIKSILDIGRTLEVLETNGVTVMTYKKDQFPAFFTANSGIKTPFRIDSEVDVANVVRAMSAMAGSGSVLAVPIPENESGNAEMIEQAILKAFKEAESQCVSGNAVTPYVLKRVNELTGGMSLISNIALVKNNAAVGARVAVCLNQTYKG